MPHKLARSGPTRRGAPRYKTPPFRDASSISASSRPDSRRREFRHRKGSSVPGLGLTQKATIIVESLDSPAHGRQTCIPPNTQAISKRCCFWRKSETARNEKNFRNRYCLHRRAFATGRCSCWCQIFAHGPIRSGQAQFSGHSMETTYRRSFPATMPTLPTIVAIDILKRVTLRGASSHDRSELAAIRRYNAKNRRDGVSAELPGLLKGVRIDSTE